MYRIFFDHLSSSLALVSIYTNLNQINRDLPLLRDFQPILVKLDKWRQKQLQQGKKDATLAKGKGKGKGNDKSQSPDDAGLEAGGIGAAVASQEGGSQAQGYKLGSAASKYISRFEPDESAFIIDMGRTMDIMENTLNRNMRTSEDLKTRLISVSGMSWNAISKSPVRNWGQLIVAATLEPHIILSYRPGMFAEIQEARVMRKQLRDYFLKITKPQYTYVDDEQVSEVVWSFVDGMYDGSGKAPGPAKSLDAPSIYRELKIARARGSRIAKKDPVRSFVETIERNHLLCCLDEDEDAKTVETLASNCISILVYVSCLFASESFFPARG